ncbi:14794_t:CDS:2 [Gigaspora margarita]|uniref:14794_t:CDS:1 n=1 Tax=Gigaspora margarita TaxID=4874 RepID=A0ABN7UTX4_GIGMA|nr:14794_t:CDS:2 [Gigaspora margarita]
MTEVLESYYVPEILAENNDEGSTSKEKNLKQEEGELSLKTVLGSFANAYLEVLKNLIPELMKKESEGERQNKENYYLNDLGRPDIIAIQTKIELTKEVLDVGTTIRKDEHDASKNYKKPTKLSLDNEVKNFKNCDKGLKGLRKAHGCLMKKTIECKKIFYRKIEILQYLPIC